MKGRRETLVPAQTHDNVGAGERILFLFNFNFILPLFPGLAVPVMAAGEWTRAWAWDPESPNALRDKHAK